MNDAVHYFGETTFNYFINFMDSILLVRNAFTSNKNVEALLHKAENYSDVNKYILQVRDHEDSLKQYNKVSMIVSLFVFFFILKTINSLVFYFWERISIYLNFKYILNIFKN
jgi:hypothetical protein